MSKNTGETPQLFGINCQMTTLPDSTPYPSAPSLHQQRLPRPPKVDLRERIDGDLIIKLDIARPLAHAGRKPPIIADEQKRKRDLGLISREEAARAGVRAVAEVEVVGARRHQLPRVLLAGQLAPREEATAVEAVGGGEDGGAAREEGAVGEADWLFDSAGDGGWGDRGVRF